MADPSLPDQSEGLDLLLNAISGDHPPSSKRARPQQREEEDQRPDPSEPAEVDDFPGGGAGGAREGHRRADFDQAAEVRAEPPLSVGGDEVQLWISQSQQQRPPYYASSINDIISSSGTFVSHRPPEIAAEAANRPLLAPLESSSALSSRHELRPSPSSTPPPPTTTMTSEGQPASVVGAVHNPVSIEPLLTPDQATQSPLPTFVDDGLLQNDDHWNGPSSSTSSQLRSLPPPPMTSTTTTTTTTGLAYNARETKRKEQPSSIDLDLRPEQQEQTFVEAAHSIDVDVDYDTAPATAAPATLDSVTGDDPFPPTHHQQHHPASNVVLDDSMIRPSLEHLLGLSPSSMSTSGLSGSESTPGLGLVPKPSVLQIDLFYPTAAQKSYANEKRFLTPAPVARLTLSQPSALSQGASTSVASVPDLASGEGVGEEEGLGPHVVGFDLALRVISTAINPSIIGSVLSENSHLAPPGQLTAATATMTVEQRKRLDLAVGDSLPSTSSATPDTARPAAVAPGATHSAAATASAVAFDAVFIGGSTSAAAAVASPRSAALAVDMSTLTPSPGVGVEVESGNPYNQQHQHQLPISYTGTTDDSLDPALRPLSSSPLNLAATAATSAAGGVIMPSHGGAQDSMPPAPIEPRPKGKQKGKQPPGGAAGLRAWTLRLEAGLSTAVTTRGEAGGQVRDQEEWESGRPRKRAKTSALVSSSGPSTIEPSLAASPLAGPSFLTLTTAPLAIRSKPPKRSKTGKHRPPTAEGSLPNGATFFLHSRINKQTTRQGALAMLASPSLQASGAPNNAQEQTMTTRARRLGVSTSTEWSRWTIERVGRAIAAVGGEGNDEVMNDDDGWVWYGDVVVLVEVQSGWRTEPLVICRAEGKAVVFDEAADQSAANLHHSNLAFDDGGNLHQHGAGSPMAAVASGGSVGQLSKVAFRRLSPGDNLAASSRRFYLSCAPNLDGPMGGTVGADGRPVAFVAGGQGAPPGRDKIDDFSLFTIGTVGSLTQTYFRLPPVLEPELWPSPGPLPSISSDPYLHADGQTLEFVIAEAYHADGVLVEIWAGPIGPLQVHQVGEQPPVFEAEDPTASGELAQVRLVVNLPAATEVADVQSRLSSAAAPSSPQSLEAAAFGALDVNVADDLPDVGEGEKRPSAGPSSAYDGGGGHDGPTAALDNLQAVAAAMASIQQQEEEARHQHQHQDDQQRQGQQHQQQQQQLADTELLDPNLHSLIELAGGEPGFSQHQHQTEQHQQHQQDQLSTEHQHRVLSAHEESAAYETQAPPPPPFVYPPPATAGTSSPPKAVPLIFVRRSRSDGVLSGLGLSVDEGGRLQIVNT